MLTANEATDVRLRLHMKTLQLDMANASIALIQ